MNYITHVCMNTGQSRRSYRSALPDTEVNLAATWLGLALGRQEAISIKDGYKGSAKILNGGLILTFQTGSLPHLVALTAYVASRSRHGSLWPTDAVKGINTAHKPREPWCCTVRPSDQRTDAALQMQAFIDSLAWAWVERGRTPAGSPVLRGQA